MMAVHSPPLMVKARSQNKKVAMPRMMPGIKMGDTNKA
jgi:hypothetical protein